jgi:hypothetical protein
MLGASTIGSAVAAAPMVALSAAAQPGGADDQAHTQFAAHRQVRQRAFGPREVDQHVGAGQALVQVGGDGHAGDTAQEGAGVTAQRRAAGQVERAAEPGVGAVDDGLDQHAAHAARRAGNGDVDDPHRAQSPSGG